MRVNKVAQLEMQGSRYSMWSAFAVLIVVCLAALMAVSKFLFGTFSIREAKGVLDKKLLLRKRYFQLFEMRENLLHHISTATSKDEISLASNLRLELDKVDKELDSIERELSPNNNSTKTNEHTHQS